MEILSHYKQFRPNIKLVMNYSTSWKHFFYQMENMRKLELPSVSPCLTFILFISSFNGMEWNKNNLIVNYIKWGRYSSNFPHVLFWNSEMWVCKQSSFAESHRKAWVLFLIRLVWRIYGKLEHVEAKPQLLLNEKEKNM